MCKLTSPRLGLALTSFLVHSLFFGAFFIYSFLSPYSTFCSLALFHVLTSVLISSPLTAMVLLSVSQSGLSEYVHALSEPFSSLCYFGHLDFD